MITQLACKIEIDKERFVIVINNKEISLPRREFELLFFLSGHQGDTLLYKVWGNEFRVINRTVDVHIRKIRTRIGEFENFIKTIKCVGYTFMVENAIL